MAVVFKYLLIQAHIFILIFNGKHFKRKVTPPGLLLFIFKPNEYIAVFLQYTTTTKALYTFVMMIFMLLLHQKYDSFHDWQELMPPGHSTLLCDCRSGFVCGRNAVN